MTLSVSKTDGNTHIYAHKGMPEKKCVSLCVLEQFPSASLCDFSSYGNVKPWLL